MTPEEHRRKARIDVELVIEDISQILADHGVHIPSTARRMLTQARGDLGAAHRTI